MSVVIGREKEALARSHTRALEAAKQAAADERTAWRAAVTEKLKRQAAEREDKLRAELLKQRDEQLEVSMASGIVHLCELNDRMGKHNSSAHASMRGALWDSHSAWPRIQLTHLCTGAVVHPLGLSVPVSVQAGLCTMALQSQRHASGTLSNP